MQVARAMDPAGHDGRTEWRTGQAGAKAAVDFAPAARLAINSRTVRSQESRAAAVSPPESLTPDRGGRQRLRFVGRPSPG